MEIDSGRFVDLLEVDAATNTRVDEMRQLLENAVYAPTRGRFKVYVIDEVHMLSNSAFNAMLKTLEEPPEHVKFILATTDPQKIPVTVLSRCLQFNLKQMPSLAITKHLAHILQAEGIPFDSPALSLVARSASGSMRDALSLLDQAIAHGAGRVEEVLVRSMLGTVDQDYLYGILEALQVGDAPALLRVASDLAVRSLSFSAALQELGALLTRLQVAQCAPSAIDEDDPDRERLQSLTTAFSPEFVQLAYQIVNVGRSELSNAPDEQAGFVMTLLRLHTFRPSSVADVIGSVVPRITATVSTRTPVAAPVAPVRIASDKEGRAVAEKLPSGDVDWHQVVASLPLTGLARELAQNCELRKLGESECLLRLPPAQTHLQMKPGPDKLQQALSTYFGRPLKVCFELAKNEADTPAEAVGRQRQERQDNAVTSITQDTFVRDAMELLDASIIESSIKPIA
jgi:DNA polymerase-3 subunit gamma/tau